MKTIKIALTSKRGGKARSQGSGRELEYMLFLNLKEEGEQNLEERGRNRIVLKSLKGRRAMSLRGREEGEQDHEERGQ